MRIRRALALSAIVLAGCVGSIGDPPEVPPEKPVLGEALLPRLTAHQYRAALVDLFGDALPMRKRLRAIGTICAHQVEPAFMRIATRRASLKISAACSRRSGTTMSTASSSAPIAVFGCSFARRLD